MSQIAIKFFAVLNPPAEPAEPNSIYLTKPDPESPFDMFVTDNDGYLSPLGNAAFVLATMASLLASKANLNSPEFTGIPIVPTAETGMADGQVASTEFVQNSFDAYLPQFAPLSSPAFTGNPTAPTQTPGNNSTRLANTAFVQAAIAALINSAPGALDTLDELAAAFGDDPNFAATVTTALAGKQPLDADLTAIAALSTTAYGRSVLAVADAAALRTLAGLVIGTNVQAYDSDLAAIAALTTSTFGRSLLTPADAAAARTLLGITAAPPQVSSYLLADVTYQNTATLANTTLSVTVDAGGIYEVDVRLSAANASGAGGFKADFNGGTATATSFTGNVQYGNGPSLMNVTALTTAPASDFFNTSGPFWFRGTLIVNAGGTFVIRAAQSTSNASITTLRAGSRIVLSKLN